VAARQSVGLRNMDKETTEPLRVRCGESHTLPVGTLFFFQYTRHGSVGEDATFEFNERGIIEFVGEEAEYLHPERIREPGITGADEERVRWIFRTAGPGEVIIHVKYLFRGTVEQECSVVIRVE